MKKIRQSAFETNSSSVHAFTALNETKEIKDYTPSLGGYGWEIDTHTGEGFIDYLATLFFCCEKKELFSDLMRLVGSSREWEDYKKESEREYWYIDHDEDKLGAVLEAIKKYGFEKVVFGFQVETGNDNCDYRPEGEFIGYN